MFTHLREVVTLVAGRRKAAMLGTEPPHPARPFVDTTAEAQAALFRVLLDADSAVDENKLRRAASTGVPPHARPVVWRMLLGVTAFDSSDGLAAEQKRTRDYANLAADADADDGEVSRRIRAVLKRSSTAYQPASTHEKKAGRQGSTSGESYDGDDDDDQEQNPTLQDAPRPNGAVNANGRAGAYVRSGRHSKVRIVDRDIVARFTRVINTFLEGSGSAVDFHADMVYLCAPFIELMSTESDAYYAFNALMQQYQHMFTDEGLGEAVSEFTTMFRSLHQDLYDHFVSEEVDINAWVRKWLRGLLVQQLPRRALLRLWDVYFANHGLDLHPYVCLVFIEHIKSELQDCDDGERITSVLGKLPPLDMDYVIAHALTAREQLRERGIL